MLYVNVCAYVCVQAPGGEPADGGAGRGASAAAAGGPVSMRVCVYVCECE